MAATQIADVVIPAQFTEYVVQNTMARTALVESGAAVLHGEIASQLRRGAESFTIPFWNDLAGTPNLAGDDPSQLAAPQKIAAGRQRVRKAFLHQSWSAMSLAAELAGSDPLRALQGRVTEYWRRQIQQRLVATLTGVLAANVAEDGGDMVVDISGETGNASKFSANAVIDTCATLGDALQDAVSVAMHSTVYTVALKADLIETIPDSQGGWIQTFRGLRVIIDDGMPNDAGVFTTAIFGSGAIGYGLSEPTHSPGTELERLPAAGRGGGQTVLHSRINCAIHPAGFSFSDTAVADESPSLAELADAANWARVVERKAAGIAFLISKV